MEEPNFLHLDPIESPVEHLFINCNGERGKNDPGQGQGYFNWSLLEHIWIKLLIHFTLLHRNV